MFSGPSLDATPNDIIRRIERCSALVDLVALMGNYAATAALLTAFDMQLDANQDLPLPPHTVSRNG
jgi:hypothetical protein